MERLPGLDAVTLLPIVRRVLDSAAAELLWWESRLHERAGQAGNITTGGVYRVWGQAIDHGVSCRWSLIVKLLVSPAGMLVPGGHVIPEEVAEDVSRFGYWRREANAFASGRLRELGGSLLAPRCYGITERPERRVWLWLEDLSDNAAAPADYALIGKQLGQFNAASIGYVPVAADAWMSRGWLRSWLETAIAGYMPVLENNDLWAHPMLQRAFGQPVQQRLLRLWHERETLLQMLERLPHAFCHLDAYPSNLFTGAGGEHSVAIDWGFAGMAALGEELAPLLIGTALVELGDSAAIEEHEQRALGGYVAGLREAGWHGDAREIQLAYRAAAALRYVFLGTEPPLRALLEPDYQAQAVRRWGRPWEQIVERRAALTSVLLDYADDALRQIR